MIRRMLALCGALAAAIMLVIPVKALGLGSILLQTNGGAVAIYRVGDVNGQSFRLDEAYGGGEVSLEDVISPSLAGWLDGQAASGETKAVDIRGKVLFSDLTPGLYLLAQRSVPAGCAPFEPFLVAIPWDGEHWNVSIDMQSPELLPKTEDPQNPGLWIFGMLASALGLAVCIQRGKDITV